MILVSMLKKGLRTSPEPLYVLISCYIFSGADTPSS